MNEHIDRWLEDVRRRGEELNRSTESGVNGCPHVGDEHDDARTCAVHVALAEAAGIYDLNDDEAAAFVQVYERVLSPGPRDS